MISNSYAKELFEEESKAAKREVRWRKRKHLSPYSVSLSGLEPEVNKHLGYRVPKRSFIRSSDIIGLLAGHRRTNYSWSFRPLPDDDAFKMNWLGRASSIDDYLDNGRISVVPVAGKYFAFDINLGDNSEREMGNNHYYCSIAKARGKVCYAKVFPLVPLELQQKIESEHPELFGKQEGYGLNRLLYAIMPQMRRA